MEARNAMKFPLNLIPLKRYKDIALFFGKYNSPDFAMELKLDDRGLSGFRDALLSLRRGWRCLAPLQHPVQRLQRQKCPRH